MTPSPCISVCQVDPPTGICLGCGRTIQEITDWIVLKDEEKERVIHQSKIRLDNLLFGDK